MLWSSRKLRYLLIGSVILTMLWYGARRFWYDAYFRQAERIEMMIICDTTMFSTAPKRVMVLYDRLALSPVSVLLGLYQHRPPERVHSYYFHEHEIAKVASDALFLENLPAGPIARVVIPIAEHNYFLAVSDRYAGGGRLIVRAQWPGGVDQAPVVPPGE